MEQTIKNKIESKSVSISDLLKNKFVIDYFQREYRWEEKHIQLLVEDLTTTFLKSYKEGDMRLAVKDYQNYYLGTVVFSINNGKKSIIDGQQRITSITLLLIYLNHLQKESSQKVSIGDLIFSEMYGEKSFNMTDETREPCLKALFECGEYTPKDSDDETVKNMVERYNDIDQVFPELRQNVLPFFIDWFKDNVVLVEITTYSDENAYTIFETTNDRGFNLTSTELLKGYVLSKITNKKQRDDINNLWKNEIEKLHICGENADQSFFQAWFRGKYAESFRQSKAGAVDQDFELIGSRFHNWFRDNHKTLFNLNTSAEFYDYFKNQFPFFVNWYIKIWQAKETFNPKMAHANYIKVCSIAESLQYPLLLAPLKFGDDNQTIERKIDFVSRYIETFTVRRAVNYKNFGQTSIRYTMFNVIKSIRDKDLVTLGSRLSQEVEKFVQGWDGVLKFGLHGTNKNFVKHLLSRITSYLDGLVGKENNTYVTYHHPEGKQFEIEHLWADKFEEHQDEFEQKDDFKEKRNAIGALILLPQGTNQSFGSSKYEDKLEHYLRENTYAQTLHQNYYSQNPNFLNSEGIQRLRFKPYPQFKKADIADRNDLVQRICEQLWSVEYFNGDK